MKKTLRLLAVLGVFGLVAAPAPSFAEPLPCGTLLCLAGLLQSPPGCGGNEACLMHTRPYFNIRVFDPFFDPQATRARRWSEWLSRCKMFGSENGTAVRNANDLDWLQRVSDYFGPMYDGPSNYDYPCAP